MNRHKKIFIALVIAIVTCAFIFLFFTFFHKTKEVSFTSKEEDWIIENRDEIFFMGYYDSRGEELFVKKLCEILSKNIGLKIVPYKDTWKNTMILLKTGKLPMTSTMNITDARNKYLKFTQSFKGLHSGIYSNIDSPIDSYEDIKGKNIGIVKNVEFLAEFKKSIPIFLLIRLFMMI